MISRRKKCLMIVVAILLVVFLVCSLLNPYLWKLTSGTINNRQFDLIAQEHNDFVGMNITDVLKLITKNGKYYIFSQESICMRLTYDEIITRYPEMELIFPREKLYCVAVCSSMSPEEIYPRGFFVNRDGIVIEPYIALSIYW